MEALVEEASTYEKCLEKINEKYGSNITITRIENQRRGGFFGLFEKDIVRVIFTLPTKPFTPDMSPFDSQTEEKQPTQPKPVKKTLPFDENLEKMKILKNAAEIKPGIKIPEPIFSTKPVQEQINLDSEQLKKLSDTVQKLANQLEQKKVDTQEHKNIEKIISILEQNDFTAKFIRKIKEKINNELSLSDLEDFDFIQKKVIDWIADSIKIKKEAPYTSGKIISLVGPTGIGKTTTLAKLAAYYVLAVSKKAGQSLNVQVITIDNYRIGAAYQMKKYCEHMKIPLFIAENAEDLHKKLDLYKNSADVICIDTTGRSPNDKEKILEMHKYFEVIDPEISETHLVVSAGTQASDIREIISQYEIFGFSSLIVTKLDESSRVGNLISVLNECPIPVAYITDGQKVPKNIKIASKSIFLKKLKGFAVESDYIEKTFDDEISIVWS